METAKGHTHTISLQINQKLGIEKMKFTLTPIKREEEMDIFVDIFSDESESNISFVAKPITFRIIQRYAVDQSSCSENGPLLTLPIKKAKAFAEQILELIGD